MVETYHFTDCNVSSDPYLDSIKVNYLYLEWSKKGEIGQFRDLLRLGKNILDWLRPVQDCLRLVGNDWDRLKLVGTLGGLVGTVFASFLGGVVGLGFVSNQIFLRKYHLGRSYHLERLLDKHHPTFLETKNNF